MPEARVDHSERDHDEDGSGEQSGDGGGGAERAMEAVPHHDGQVQDVAAGQELGQRIGLVELVGGHPAAVLDQHAGGGRDYAPRNRGGGAGGGGGKVDGGGGGGLG